MLSWGEVLYGCDVDSHGAYTCMSVISIKLQSGIVGMALPRVCSPVDSLRISTVSLLEITTGGQLLNIDSFVYNF